MKYKPLIPFSSFGFRRFLANYFNDIFGFKLKYREYISENLETFIKIVFFIFIKKANVKLRVSNYNNKQYFYMA